MHKRNESVIYYDTQIDLTNTIKFLEEYNKNRKEEDKLTLFQIYLAAATRTVTLRPKINRFVSNRRLWQRNEIIFSFVVNKEKSEEGEEVNARIDFDPFDTLETVQKNVSKHLYEARYGKNPNEKDIQLTGALPRWMIRFIFWLMRWTDQHNIPIKSWINDMPLWSTAFIAHLGSIGIDAVYHHQFELGTTGLFFAIGKMDDVPIINKETKEIEIRKIMELRISIDDRIAPGIYTGPTVYMLKEFIENPEPLLKPPELTDEQLDMLMLKKYKKERLEREKLGRKAKRKKK